MGMQRFDGKEFPGYPIPDWAVGQLERETGLIEDVCEHGVGHPNATWLEKNDGKRKLGVHGCDGCCSKT